MPRGIEVTQARAGRAKSQLPVAVAASRTVKTRFNPRPEPPFCALKEVSRWWADAAQNSCSALWTTPLFTRMRAGTTRVPTAR